MFVEVMLSLPGTFTQFVPRPVDRLWVTACIAFNIIHAKNGKDPRNFGFDIIRSFTALIQSLHPTRATVKADLARRA
jgi:hypothetical protein